MFGQTMFGQTMFGQTTMSISQKDFPRTTTFNQTTLILLGQVSTSNSSGNFVWGKHRLTKYCSTKQCSTKHCSTKHCSTKHCSTKHHSTKHYLTKCRYWTFNQALFRGKVV
jgi:hypothetical protein